MIPRPSTAHADGNGGPPLPPFPHMVWIPGGTFLMGSNDFYPEERPVHGVTVDGFWMDEHEEESRVDRRPTTTEASTRTASPWR